MFLIRLLRTNRKKRQLMMRQTRYPRRLKLLRKRNRGFRTKSRVTKTLSILKFTFNFKKPSGFHRHVEGCTAEMSKSKFDISLFKQLKIESLLCSRRLRAEDGAAQN